MLTNNTLSREIKSIKNFRTKNVPSLIINNKPSLPPKDKVIPSSFRCTFQPKGGNIKKMKSDFNYSIDRLHPNRKSTPALNTYLKQANTHKSNYSNNINITNISNLSSHRLYNTLSNNRNMSKELFDSQSSVINTSSNINILQGNIQNIPLKIKQKVNNIRLYTKPKFLTVQHLNPPLQSRDKISIIDNNILTTDEFNTQEKESNCNNIKLNINNKTRSSNNNNFNNINILKKENSNNKFNVLKKQISNNNFIGNNNNRNNSINKSKFNQQQNSYALQKKAALKNKDILIKCLNNNNNLTRGYSRNNKIMSPNNLANIYIKPKENIQISFLKYKKVNNKHVQYKNQCEKIVRPIQEINQINLSDSEDEEGNIDEENEIENNSGALSINEVQDICKTLDFSDIDIKDNLIFPVEHYNHFNRFKKEKYLNFIHNLSPQPQPTKVGSFDIRHYTDSNKSTSTKDSSLNKKTFIIKQ